MRKRFICALIGIIICVHPVAAFAASNSVKPPSNATSNKITARYGMKGNDVKKVQEQLIKAGFLQGKADGIFGNATYMAVKSFQNASKLKPDGLVGSKTLAALKKYKPPKNQPQPKQTKAKPSPVKTVKPALQKKSQQHKQSHLVPRKPEPPKRESGIPQDWRPISLEATAYTRYDEGCTDFTFRGSYVRKGLVAVDPDIIPLGTKLYVPDYGYAVADDIGGAIQGYKIDLAMETLDEAFAYGRRHITAYIIS